MNIATAATIAQVSLPSATLAESGGSSSSSSIGGGSPFQSVLASVITSAVANVSSTPAKPVEITVNAGLQQPTGSQSANTSSIDASDTPDSDQTTAPKRKPAPAATKVDATTTTVDQFGASPAVIVNSIELPAPGTVTAASTQAKQSSSTANGVAASGLTPSTNVSATATLSNADTNIGQAVSSFNGPPNSTAALGTGLQQATSPDMSAPTLPAEVGTQDVEGALQGFATKIAPGVNLNPMALALGKTASVPAEVIPKTATALASVAAEKTLKVAADTSVEKPGNAATVAASAANSPDSIREQADTTTQGDLDSASSSSSSTSTVTAPGIENLPSGSTIAGTTIPGLIADATSSGMSSLNAETSKLGAINPTMTAASTSWVTGTSANSVTDAGVEQSGTPQSGKKVASTVGKPTTNLTASAGQQSASSTSALASNPETSSSTNAASSVTSQLGDTVIQQAQSLGNGDQSSVVLRLNPPELGKINVHVSMTNDVVAVRMVASNDATQQIISGQMNDLRQSLSNQGLSLGQFQVDSNSGGQQSFSGSQQSFQESTAQQSYTGSARQMAVAQSGSSPQAVSRTQLNYVA